MPGNAPDGSSYPAASAARFPGPAGSILSILLSARADPMGSARFSRVGHDRIMFDAPFPQPASASLYAGHAPWRAVLRAARPS
ncbi:hypothetical protein CFR79_10005 [Komagataeibacter saccharivorans]|uniref:hypothetical protein n=1 Tax=Komagataeibacter saccharivorans TaxID=265959 RepID=UPI000D7CA744|nr:hypothetical protein [Komagataeibacter saccharivorans]PYD50270.1 hypothetical protein CFR79_10005 [Komagataeibacter saccharivorans]